MKKILFIFWAMLVVLPALSQPEIRQNRMIFRLYTPEEGAPYAEVIDNYLFLSELTDVVIPSYVSYDGVDYPVTIIGDGVFSECKYISRITIPNTVTTIGDNAFNGCYGLTSVTIGNSVATIGNSAFYYCSGLTSLTFPESLTSIGNRAFYECRSLTSLTFPESLTSVGEQAFSRCWYVTTVTFGNSATYIGAMAFDSCFGLTSLTLPESMKYIGAQAFSFCSNLKEIIYNVKTRFIIAGSKNVFPEGIYSKATLYLPASFFNQIRTREPWKNFVNIRELGLSGIEDIDGDIDYSAPITVYDLRGVKVGTSTDGLRPGVYIVRQNNAVKKIRVN